VAGPDVLPEVWAIAAPPKSKPAEAMAINTRLDMAVLLSLLNCRSNRASSIWLPILFRPGAAPLARPGPTAASGHAKSIGAFTLTATRASSEQRANFREQVVAIARPRAFAQAARIQTDSG
jgi:hypothetical protein